MKKIYLLLCAATCAFSSFAQPVVLGGDMETWRSGTSGGSALGSSPVPIQAPAYWYGEDSLIIGEGQAFGTFFMIPPNSWSRQLFEESTIVHSGSHSAKMITMKQDTLGFVPGVLSNSLTHVQVLFTPPYIGPITFTGGSAVTQKPQTVSAWVQYFPGKDNTGATGIDSGELDITAISKIHGIDSIIGTGTAVIGPSSSWVLVTANMTYPLDDTDVVDTLRITFTSGGGGNALALDSSALYVDDVTMTVFNEAVPGLTLKNSLVNIYPNPTNGTLYLDAPQTAGLTCRMFSISGQAVAAKTLQAGANTLDVSSLPPSLYFYDIADKNGIIVQRGKVSVVR